MDHAVKLVGKMHYLKTSEDMEHLIRHSYIADEFKPDKLVEIIDALADPEKCLAILSSKSFENDTLPIHEKWYNHNYSLAKFSEERLQELRAVSVPDNGKSLDLPPPNNLIASNFDLLPED